MVPCSLPFYLWNCNNNTLAPISTAITVSHIDSIRDSRKVLLEKPIVPYMDDSLKHMFRKCIVLYYKNADECKALFVGAPPIALASENDGCLSFPTRVYKSVYLW